MLKRLLSLTLVGLLLHMVAVAPVSAGKKDEQDARRAEKVKKAIAKLGTGEKARIKVELKDKTKVKGYVSEISEDGFKVTDTKSGTTTDVAYTEVKQVEGRNLSTGAKIAIGLGIAAGALIIVALIGIHDVRSNCCF